MKRRLLYLIEIMTTFITDVVINGILSSYLIPVKLRSGIISIWTLGKMKGSIYGHCYIESSKLIIGKGTYINRNCLICNKSDFVEIGEFCALAYGVAVHTTNHDYSNPRKRSGKVNGAKVTIGNGCWIGAAVVICPGADIGSGCVIAAGSVVVGGKYQSNCLYGGNPARFIKKLS